MAEMKSKKQVNNLVVLAVAMVLMANYFVSCENTKIGDVGSHHHHDHQNDGNNVKESHDLAPHHHDNGNRKMEAGSVIGPKYSIGEGCRGDGCFFVVQDCRNWCICVPLPQSLFVIGICAGHDCDCG